MIEMATLARDHHSSACSARFDHHSECLEKTVSFHVEFFGSVITFSCIVHLLWD